MFCWVFFVCFVVVVVVVVLDDVFVFTSVQKLAGSFEHGQVLMNQEQKEKGRRLAITSRYYISAESYLIIYLSICLFVYVLFCFVFRKRGKEGEGDSCPNCHPFFL